MYVLGTAGHVDHGKSTLVEALTGINPDRLAEEQRREMTIDLGFAWLTLPSGKVVSVVDVPGHERFIKNMLAGVGGIDAALLIVAADEGIMPQTAEHLHILDLLGVEHGIVVLTKRDLVDEEWLELVAEETRERMQGTTLRNAPLVPVSARTGVGLDDLKRAIDALLAEIPSRTAGRGAPRLPIDRVFTVGGFGTIVTGTLLDGPLAVGDEVEIAPSGARSRVRGLQTHNSKVERALPGTRVAANLAGLPVEALRRGDVVTAPGAMEPTAIVDLKLRLVADAPRPLEQNDALDLFAGAAEVACHVTLLDCEKLPPGGEAWVQLRLERPIAVARGDRCIVRIPSPSITAGGGRIVDAHPRRHRRFRPEVITALETLERGTPADLLVQAAGSDGPVEWNKLKDQSGLTGDDALAALGEALRGGRLRRLGPNGDPGTIAPDSLLVSEAAWKRLTAMIEQALAAFHRRNPLRAGMPREELKSKAGIRAPRAFNETLQLLQSEGEIATTETSVRLPTFSPRLSPKERAAVDNLLRDFEASPFSPPTRAEWEELGNELIGYLIDTGRLVRVSPDVLFSGEGYTKLVEWTTHLLAEGGEVTVATLRDQFSTSRKYALALLEHLDERKITRRVGDARVKY
jgi:selenocysteine-specific elongation factor